LDFWGLHSKISRDEIDRPPEKQTGDDAPEISSFGSSRLVTIEHCEATGSTILGLNAPGHPKPMFGG
jgi:hypothetical protein